MEMPNESMIKGKTKDLTGQRFGRLVAVSYAGAVKHKAQWDVLCDCGVKRRVGAATLKRGITKSCGCLHREILSKRSKKHGESHKSAEYSTWKAMRARCMRVNSVQFADYGGRGIKVCSRWDSYENFLKDMGRKPTPGHSIDRIDNDGGYCPENCRWATHEEQSRNKRTSRMLTYGGKSQCVVSWAEELGMAGHVLQHRIDRGWTVERALTTPVKDAKGKQLTYQGKTQPVSHWAKELGVHAMAIHSRLRLGWSVERTLTQPVKSYRRKGVE
jgi:hypothetical protein